MKKGFGCFGFLLAVSLGLILGLAGLGVAGYYWMESRVLTKEAGQMEPLKWGALDEAGLGVKLAPVALSIRQGHIHQGQVGL